MALVKFKNRAGQWVELVIDNLTTESAVQALSAKQGKVLQTNKADKATTLAGYGIADAYTKTEIDALIASVFKYKGVKATYADVEAVQNPSVGDVWFVTADGSEYAWNGTVWEKLGPVIDLSHFLTSLSIAGITLDVSNTTITSAQLIQALNIYTKSEVYNKTEVDTLLAGKVPTSRKVNGHALDQDVTVSKSDVGLGNVDNTPDTDKPVSTAQQTALNGKADKVSNPTDGNLAALESNGNIKDSGKKASDFVASNQGSANAGKALGISNDGTVIPVPFSGEDFTGATEQTGGTHGYVPAPEAGDQDKFLKADGTWREVPAAEEMEGATASTDGTGGSVPAPLAGDQDKFLKGDGTWGDVPDPQTMEGATSQDDGAGGLVPAPSAGDQDKFLKGDGTWDDAPDPTSIIDDTAGDGDTDKVWSADKTTDELNGKADKVPSATDGNLAGLDSTGNITDSGIALDDTAGDGDTNKLWSADKVYDELATKVPTTRKVNGHALSEDVTVTKGDVGLSNVDNTSDTDKPISTATQTALNGKADKVSNATNGNLAELDSNGNLTDSGKSPSDFALANQAIQYATYSNNTISLYRNTDGTGTAAFKFNLPEEMFLDQAHTSFVGNFAWSSTLYPGSTNPNLDGKPVMVLAVKGDATNPNYSFINMTALVDTYQGADASIVVSNYTIGVQIDPTVGNALTLVANKGLRVDISSKADRDTDAVEGNFAEFDANGNPVDSGHKHSDYATKVASPTNGDFAGLDANGNITDSGKKPSDFILASEKGSNSGVATLDSSGKVPSSQLPSSVDSVVKGYYYNGSFYEEAAHTTLITPETDKIYIDLATDHSYYWWGSAYARIDDPTEIIDDTAGDNDTDKTWSADKLVNEFNGKLDTDAIDDTAGDGNTDKIWSADKLVDEFNTKADKVQNATSGNFAGLDAKGNLIDSGSKASDFLTQHQDISGKADKVQNATSGNFAGLDANGNLTDSGKKASDFLTQHQDISGKVDKNQGVGNAGKALGINSQGMVEPVTFSGDDFTGATSSTAGVHGYVPAPAAGDQGKFLRADGTWSNVPDPQVMTGATAQDAGTSGLTPAPAAGDATRYLRSDGTWAVPPDTHVAVDSALDSTSTNPVQNSVVTAEFGKTVRGNMTVEQVKAL